MRRKIASTTFLCEKKHNVRVSIVDIRLPVELLLRIMYDDVNLLNLECSYWCNTAVNIGHTIVAVVFA